MVLAMNKKYSYSLKGRVRYFEVAGRGILQRSLAILTQDGSSRCRRGLNRSCGICC